MMKKYLLLLLPLFLTLSCFADNPDRSHLYTLQETVEITLPEDGAGNWRDWGEGFSGANLFYKNWDRYTGCWERDDEDHRDEDVQIISQHLFGCSRLEISDLLSIYLKGSEKYNLDVVLVEELEDGVIVRILADYIHENWKEETTTRKAVYLVRLILSDVAYHTISYSRDDESEVVTWSDEDQELWTECLRNAQLVPLG